MPHAGEVVTLAEGPINVSIGRQVADALPTEAVTSSTAGGVIRGLFAGLRAQCVLPTLTVRTHVARVAGAHPTLEGTVSIVAFGAVHLHFFLTVTFAFRTDKYFKGVPQPHRLYDNVPVSSLTVWYTHSHVKCSLEKKIPIIFFHPPKYIGRNKVAWGSALSKSFIRTFLKSLLKFLKGKIYLRSNKGTSDLPEYFFRQSIDPILTVFPTFM